MEPNKTTRYTLIKMARIMWNSNHNETSWIGSGQLSGAGYAYRSFSLRLSYFNGITHNAGEPLTVYRLELILYTAPLWFSVNTGRVHSPAQPRMTMAAKGMATRKNW